MALIHVYTDVCRGLEKYQMTAGKRLKHKVNMIILWSTERLIFHII